MLRERYQMVEQLQPVFAKAMSRNSRYYIRDNFLLSWLAALVAPAASVNFRPLDELVREADERLRGWRVEKVAIATRHSPETRKAAQRAGYLAQDLDELTSGL